MNTPSAIITNDYVLLRLLLLFIYIICQAISGDFLAPLRGQNIGVSEALIGLLLAEFLFVPNPGGEGSRRL